MSHDIYSTIIENSPIGYCIISKDLKLLYINDRLLSYLETNFNTVREDLWIKILIEKNFMRKREKIIRRWLAMKMNPLCGSTRIVVKLVDDLRTEFFIQIDLIPESDNKLITIYPISGTILLHHSRATAKLSHEYEIARNIQRNLNDFIIDVIEGRYFKYYFSRLFLPSGILSGDIVNIKTVSRRYSSLFLGDGRGHGLPAALYSSLINSYLNIMASSVTHGIESTSHLMNNINDFAYRDFNGTGEYYFFSGVYGLIDGNTKDFIITNAGHPYPVFIRDRQVSRMKTHGPIVGAFEKSVYEEQRIPLNDGDIFIFFTDGIYDILPQNSQDDKDDGISGIVESFLSDPDNRTENVFDYLKKTIQSFRSSNDINDDITILEMRVEGKQQE